MEYLDKCYDLLPPHYRQVEKRKGATAYLNEVTGELSHVHPLDRYRQLLGHMVGMEPLREEESPILEDKQEDPPTLQLEHPNSTDNPRPTVTLPAETEREDLPSRSSAPPMTPATTKTQSGPHLLDYHCEWKERDVFGKSSIYGLTLRYNLQDGSTSVRFDGVADSEWSFTALQGPYGALDLHDLFVHAKIQVFGRHLTISSANSHAVKWITQEANRLQKLQAKFRRKIESVGHKPVITPKAAEVVRHVTRDTKKAGEVNLRKMLIDTAKLGEQLTQLGLSEFAII